MTRPARLVVLRHAKSAWPDGVADLDRPLSGRGRRDAPAAGHWLREAGLLPDTVVCSPALRTRQTWDLLSGELDATPTAVHDPRLYAASSAELLHVVRETDESCRTLLLIGHSPGVQDLVVALTGAAAIGDCLARVRRKFPTSAIAVLTLPGTWKGLTPGSCVLVDFAVPRGEEHR
ncbi:SixA phosphatase family protein [Streptomyces sp. NPDC008122]|uniref:SixA phosphatase family protein n=1 Tax=Streptomyces sp. NPDC008122 TaxID=3364810 RepID=UPI0036EE3270